jgi:hypothetical protein
MALLILFWPIKHLNVHSLFSYKVKIISVMNIVTINQLQSQIDANFSSLDFLDFSQVFRTWLQYPHLLIDSRCIPQFALSNLDL